MRKMLKKDALATVGGMSKPGKMPGTSYSTSTLACHVGGKLRDVGLTLLRGMKGPAARIIKKKGEAWVKAQLHKIANRKTKDGADAAVAKVKAREALTGEGL